MSLCIKSTQVWVFPERREIEKLFSLTCRGGERGAKEELSGVMRMSHPGGSGEGQFESLPHKSVFLIDSIIEFLGVS